MQKETTRLKLSFYDELRLAISNKTAKVLVIGLGYIGSSIAKAIASSGFKVYGYDISTDRIKEIQLSEIFIRKKFTSLFVQTSLRAALT